MTSFDILKLYTQSYPTLNLDIISASNFEKLNRLDKAAEKYRFIARNLLSLKLNIFSIDFYKKASELFINGKRYEKAIATEMTIYEIFRLENDYQNMATTYEKIASFYKYFLKDQYLAGTYYFMSAKLHEKNQNYLSAFNKARYAIGCFEETNNLDYRRNSHALAFRMALQSNYYERAGIHAKKWLLLMPKDYSPHYMSVCMKGYKSFLDTNRGEDALFFVNEIIIAHYEKNIIQDNITNYLIDAQKLYLKEKKDINQFYNNKILAEYGEKLNLSIKYSIECKSYAQNSGLDNVGDIFYFQEKDLIRKRAKQCNNYPEFIGYSIWKYSCSYGTSLIRWIMASAIIIIFFGALYTQYHYSFTSCNLLNNLLRDIKPSIRITTVNNWFSPYYYSVVTFATLGYGDILPCDLAGQISSVIEVVIGYLMLGGLLSVFSKKIVR